MPFINVKMLSGRSTEQKRALVEALTAAMVDTCGADQDGTTVVIEEYEREHWAKGGVLISDR
ncbi:MAG TPA: 4-oxalocrotonate tautomerase family protein [Candidatus Latescibacteria bacterium]|nr:4-oxalocrotonate tautomerase family protein [Candidatus Handelsmanbacteria bacterium]HIL09697.1 4-oxalocrotonate tautomerase family protein [Candidatus Latescibacterota bacterium]